MSREDGFAVMDVSVDIANDPKVRKLFRYAPDHALVAFMAYVATMGESWKAGRRVNVDDAWPPALPFSRPAVDALIHVGMLDARGQVPAKAWRAWFEVARERRLKSRDRWARYNAKRDADTTSLPRGSDVGTATSVPSVPSDRPSVPPKAKRDSTTSENGRDPDRLVQPLRTA